MINIKRSSEPKESFHYKDEVVKTKLKQDFYNLCYLCEEYSPRHQEVDHFSPQKHDRKKVNTWENLFLICEKCNKIRPKDINSCPEKEVYNNCIDDVENLILLSFDFETKSVKFISSENSTKSVNTINLLERIYNGKASTSLDYLELQKELKNKMDYFNSILRNLKDIKNEQLKEPYKQILIENIQKSYHLRTEKIDYNYVGFTSFKRNILKENVELYESLKHYFD